MNAPSPILMIHGMWSTPHVWTWLADHYRARGHMVATPALPLHDTDPKAPPVPGLAHQGIDDHVAAMVESAQALDGPPIIIGHSMGGLIAQRVAAQLPHAALVLIAPAPSTATHAFGLAPLQTLFDIVSDWGWWRHPVRISPEAARRGIYNDMPPEEADREIARHVWDSGRALCQITLPWFDNARATRVDYTRLTRPALVLIGTHDRLTPAAIARATARKLCGPTDYREITGAGHWPFHPQARLCLAREIDAFLDRLSS